MASGSLSNVLRYLRGAVATRDGGELTDGHLLQSFIERSDEEAFETLVRRHAAMVLGVCRRVLRHQQDAEDAFQATFLVLARKAPSIASRDTVGNWLYGVAYRTAQKARVGNARRRHRETQAATMPRSEHPTNEDWIDLQPLLDQELYCLPAKYRSPLVLCDVEGKTRPEAARQLGWSEGTLSWRLASARTMLARRLTRRGVALSAGALALMLSQAASASVPAPLVLATVKSAAFSASGQAVAAGLISADVAALTEGVLRAMYYTKLKVTSALCLALALMGTGVGVASYGALAVSGDGAHAINQAASNGEDVALAEGREGGEPKKEADVVGAISTIAADGKMLTVQPPGGRGARSSPVDVKLTDKTRVEFDDIGKELNRKLKVGDLVSVTLENGSASLIEATASPEVAGKITAVSANGKTITIESTPFGWGGPGAKTFEIKITDKTKMRKPASRGNDEVAPLKPEVGLSASVWLMDGSKDTAAAIDVSKPDVAPKRR